MTVQRERSTLCFHASAMAEVAHWVAPARLISDSSDSLGCDSSDCLLCQYSSAPCEQHPHGIHRSLNRSSAGSMRARKRHAALSATATTSRRAQVSSDSSNPSSSSFDHSSELNFPISQTGNPSSTSHSLLPRPWHWQPAWAAYQHPAPAHLQTLARLLPNRQAQQAQQAQQHSRSIVSALDFSPAGTLLAAGSVNKEVTVYSLPDMEATSSQAHSTSTSSLHSDGPACQFIPLDVAAVYNTPGKISCLSWDPSCEGLVTIGDYDGVMYQVHLPTGHHVTELEAHSGRRIWSVAHSRLQPRLCISASDDCTARLWAGRGLSTEALVIRPPPASPWGRAASVCCAEFSPVDEHVVALASADHSVYLYDIRAAEAPMEVLRFHSRPVSYVRFLGARTLVSSSTDGSLALWDLDGGAAAGGADRAPRKVMRGHRNAKNFVGLSVLPEEQLIACGSESGTAYAYHTSWDAPLASCGVASEPSCARPDGGCGGGRAAPCEEPGSGAFVSSVCWQPAEAAAALGLSAVLAAGTWCGEIALLALAHGHAQPVVCDSA